MSIRLSLGAAAASFEGYILAAFIRCRRRSQRVKQIRSRSTVIRYTHLYMYLYAAFYFIGLLREHSRGAADGSAGHVLSFVCSFLFFVQQSDDARKTPKYALPSRLGASRPRDTANVTFTMFDYRRVKPSLDQTKGISANGRNTSEDEERQRSNNVRYCSASSQKRV